MPTILLAQEDAEAREKFSALILGYFPTALLRTADTWENLLEALPGLPDPAVGLSDIFWQGEDRSSELILAAENCPRVSLAVFGRYELSDTLPAGFPIPVLAPDENLPLRLTEQWEDLSGREFGSYRISAPAGPHGWGRLYWANHRELQRPVQILVPPAGSPGFPRAIQAWARINHPGVYSLYESIPWEGRILVALEPVIYPSLLHLRLTGQALPLLACARLATTLASVLSEMDSASVPARPLGEYDYTLSPKGIPRLRNPAADSAAEAVSTSENTGRLAEILEPILAREARSQPLLQILRHPGTSPADLLRQTREFERQLATVREVHVRKEEREAAAKTLQARVIRRWAIALGLLMGVAFLSLYARVVYHKFVLDVPAKLEPSELPVPAGRISLDGEMVEIGGFFLDRHEVTIGDFEKFLAAARENPAWRDWVPEQARAEKTTVASLEPKDWAEILRRARKNEKYQEQKISRDTPVFNVDYPSAVAYAKWRGRRLPTLEEWSRAAGGNEGLPFPWGSEPRGNQANLGILREEPTSRDPGDSWFNAAPGESFPSDRGPFGHFDLGGNVSEWAVGPRGPVIVGGNFTDPEPVPLSRIRRQDSNRRDAPASARLEVVGFRTAR